MDSQQPVQPLNELTARPRAPMEPVIPSNPKSPAGPRFPPVGDGSAADSLPRFPPPGAVLSSPGAPQFLPPRPLLGQPIQRAPPPRNPNPLTANRPPLRLPAPPGQQPLPSNLLGQQPLGITRPPPPIGHGQQGAPIRVPFPSMDPRAPRPPLGRGMLQRIDSVGGPDNKLLMQPGPPPVDQQQLQPLQNQQQIPDRSRTPQLQPQMSAERIMTEAEINQQRPQSNTSLKSHNSDVISTAASSGIKSAISEDEKPSGESHQETKETKRIGEKDTSHGLQSNDKNESKKTNAKSSEEVSTKPLEQSNTVRSESASSVKPKGSLAERQQSSDNESILGFNDGQRRSLSSAKSPVSQPGSKLLSPSEELGKMTATVETKRGITFADDYDEGVNKNTQRTGPKSKLKLDITTSKTSENVASPARKEKEMILKKSPSSKSIREDAENDSGVDESTQRKEATKSNGVTETPKKTSDKRSVAGSPVKSPSKSIKSLPKTPEATPSTAEKKKVPMNKVQVGAAPSPNLKAVRSKIGSLQNTTYKPGGGNVKIENRKLDFSKAQPKIAAKNDKYAPSGGEKKITQVKLQWNAKPKIGSLDNATYKPGGGDKKIETVKLDFKEKAKPKVGSKENAKHTPGGGAIKIDTQKIEIKAESKIGSLDNVKHKPGGGDKKIFDDKSYLRQTSSTVGSVSGSGSQSPIRSGAGSIAGDNNQEY